jgi:hypothetical protein
MIKPSYQTNSLCIYQKGYQQALEDFAIPNLLAQWCYLIWWDKQSSSNTRFVADIAWEHDLEPVDEEKIL